MTSFAISKIVLGLVISLLVVRLALAAGMTSSILLVAGATIGLFAAVVFRSLAK